MKIAKEELHGNNWLKILFDKGFRYFFTIGIFWLFAQPLELISPPLLTVAVAMPFIDLVVFRVIDRMRKSQ